MGDSIGWPAAATIMVGMFGVIGGVTSVIVAKIMAGRESPAKDSEIAEKLIERFVLAIEHGIAEGLKKIDSTRFNAEQSGTIKEWSRNTERRMGELEGKFEKISEPLIRWAMTVGPEKHG